MASSMQQAHDNVPAPRTNHMHVNDQAHGALQGLSRGIPGRLLSGCGLPGQNVENDH